MGDRRRRRVRTNRRYEVRERGDDPLRGRIETEGPVDFNEDSLMSGTGDFQIVDAGCGVLIDQYISCYGGDFQLTKGTLDIRKRVCTSGKFNAGHDGGSDDAYLIVKKATSGSANEFLFGADCGCQ